jgi:hypothetical protein
MPYVTRHAELLETVTRYRQLAAENYVRIRTLAETLRDGYCAWLESEGPPCVLLAPPQGAFEARDYGDQAFSVPPRGFQPLVPIQFGLIVRVTEANDWLRVTLSCVKSGDAFSVSLSDGRRYEFQLPLEDNPPEAFFDMLHAHILTWFSARSEEYLKGEEPLRPIGFDFSRVRADPEV